MEGPETNQEELNSFLSLFETLSDRQNLDIYGPVIVGVAGGLAPLAFQLLLPLLAPLPNALTSTTLERPLVPLLPPLSMPGLPAVAVTTTREGRRRLQNKPAPTSLFQRLWTWLPSFCDGHRDQPL